MAVTHPAPRGKLSHMDIVPAEEIVASVVLEIPALHCDGCLASVAAVLSVFPGVIEVEGHLADKRVDVRYDLSSITPDAMAKQLAMAGYPVASTRSA